jgi:hypothetical protein
MQTKKRFFRKVATPAVFGVMLLLLTACPSKEPVHIDLGRIPEQYLATVPYQNGDVFRMQHETSKVIIEFEVERHRHKTSSEGYGTVPTRFEPAPDYYYEYEVDMTTCKPKYPVFDLSISLSNAYMLNEEEMQPWYKKADLFAVGSAKLPFIGDDHSDCEIIDSLEVNGRYYKDVFKLKTDYYNYDDELIHAETIFYNYENGFVGIVMSNGEKYMLYED